jgi:hypothetical protein
MAERFPLIYNPIANQIQELPEGDTLAGSSGGSGQSAGTVIKYPDNTNSPFILSSVHITQNITLDDSNADTVPSNVITNESIITVDDSVTVTIEDNKTVVPDLYNVMSDTYINN